MHILLIEYLVSPPIFDIRPFSILLNGIYVSFHINEKIRKQGLQSYVLLTCTKQIINVKKTKIPTRKNNT